MNRFIQNIKNIWKVEELRKRIILTLTLILVYRVGSFVILPGVNYTALMNAQANGGQNTLETLLSLFSGGGFTNASVMALGIMPYISASIIMQLLGMAVPAVQKMQNEGESGRKRINNYTRILTIIICALQAPSYLTLYVQSKGAMPVDASTFWWVQTILVLISGSMFAVWLGERITEKGFGNGISMIIFAGIVAGIPQAIGQAIESVRQNDMNILVLLLLLVITQPDGAVQL
jgi:preprotein translocase subunit SecY